ncbi:hypothetical protein LTS18_013977 [Coniosporium uncinatum]|uniref:Uncharacterized protein n=1 Tax=Coniosporium uncinatum TaxID=93489 RepID=A0ACC3DZ57_9PEZI|nr:hypothetical protein LTS18_013977 [Coniosporium uncinatum]
MANIEKEDGLLRSGKAGLERKVSELKGDLEAEKQHNTAQDKILKDQTVQKLKSDVDDLVSHLLGHAVRRNELKWASIAVLPQICPIQ